MKKLFQSTTALLLGSAFLFIPSPIFAEETSNRTPLAVHSGGTGASSLIEAKENLEIPEVVGTGGNSDKDVMHQQAVKQLIVASGGSGVIVADDLLASSSTEAISQRIAKQISDATDVLSSDLSSLTNTVNNLPQFTIEDEMGQYANRAISQRATTQAFDDIANSVISKSAITNTTGSNIDRVMSQKAVTDAILTAQTIFNMIYPVGAVYISVDAADPNIIFGGSWERIQDTFLLAAGDTYIAGSDGGNAFTTLTSANMPSHTHTFSNGSATSAGAHQHNLRGNTAVGGYAEGVAYNNTNSPPYSNNSPCVSSGAHTHTVTGTISSSGNANPEAINNMPPYLAVYMWKRISL